MESWMSDLLLFASSPHIIRENAPPRKNNMPSPGKEKRRGKAKRGVSDKMYEKREKSCLSLLKMIGISIRRG